MLYQVTVPPREFAIGGVWADRLGPSMRSTSVPSDCIVCGTPGNACRGDERHGTAGKEEASEAK